MAVSRIMKRAVRRVADILGAYAREQGWWPLDFRLYYRTNEKWGRLDFLFVSDGFDGWDEHEAYSSVMNHLSLWLGDERELYEAVGVVIQTFKQTAQKGLYSIPSAYDMVRPRDLVVRALNEVASLVVKYAKDRGWADGDYLVLYRLDPTNRARVQILVACLEEAVSGVPYGNYFLAYVGDRLFDEPDLLRTFDLEIRPPMTQAQADDLKKVGYTEFFTKSRSLIS